MNADNLTVGKVAVCTARDLALVGWYSYLLYLVYSGGSDMYQCYSDSNIVIWAYGCVITGVLRLIKNPLQLLANRELEARGSSWSNPQNSQSALVTFCSPSNQCCQMRMYTFFDTCSYVPWIFGLAAIQPPSNLDKSKIDMCINTLAVKAGMFEIFGTTILYIFTVLLFAVCFTIHRFSKGRLLPGFMIYRSEDSCPFIHFDRSQWRQPGEDLQAYRARVIEHFGRMEMLLSQPIAMQNMRTAVQPLTTSELEQLKTFRYNLRTLRPSPSVVSLTGRVSLSRRPSRRSVRQSMQSLNGRNNPGALATVVDLEAQQTVEKQTVDQEEPKKVQIVAPNTTDNQNRQERTTDDTCALCIEEYEENDLLRELFCGHRFHSECVDEWLTKSKRTCPVCNADALGKEQTST